MHRLIAVTFCGLLLATTALAQPGSTERQARLRAVVERLTAPELEGRRVGEAGGQRAQEYLRAQLAALGLQPAALPAEAVQFDVTRGIRIAGTPLLRLEVPETADESSPATASIELGLGQDYSVADFSGSSSVADAPLAFAGYGISAPDLGWDDYAGLEVRGGIAVIVRGEPQATDPASRFSGDQPSPYADLRRKAAAARDRGAVGLLVLNNPLTDTADELPQPQATYSAANFDIPVLFVKRAVLEGLVEQGAGHDLTTLLQAMDRYGSPASTLLGAWADLDVQVERDLVPGRNLVYRIPGTDPALNDHYIVIGAHYDHLGHGGPESLAPGQFGAIHGGADDNASGVAAVLDLAAQLVAAPLRRPVLLALFDAEEIGTIGSRYLAEALPAESIHAMLNFDMVGRLREDTLIVGGTGTAAEFEALLAQAAPASDLTIQRDAGGFGASDHMSFVQRKRPVLFFFTGVHEDYHKPSDTPDKLNYEGLARIVDFSAAVVRGIDGRDTLTYVEVAPTQAPQRSRGNLTVTLGTVPSYVESPVPGMAVGDVVPDGPAARAGILGGDVIVRIGDKKVGNIYDFMYALEGRSAGEVVEVEVVRGTEQLVFSVTLAARNVEQ